MNRRRFMATGLASTAALLGSARITHGQEQSEPATTAVRKFKLKYAPSIDQFKQQTGNSIADGIKVIADNGFTAVFDNGLMGRSAQEQEAIAKELEKHNMTLGPFVAYADFRVESLVTGKKEDRQMIADKMKDALQTAKRTGARWALLVPGRYSQRLEWDYQTANVIEGLKTAAAVCEPAGLVMVIEPLNKHDHPGLFLTTIPQAYQICRAVGSPCCKIVNDIYHQQITEGNLIPNIDMAWSEIAAFHLGDNPGRREPGTGEINYRNIFKHLREKGYDGVLCMEHGLSKGGLEGEKALVEAYRVCDDF